ncbi:MAG: antitoxin [archaeon]
MVFARIKLDDYSNRVLNVIKARYDLKDKSEAITKFIQIYGKEEVEPEISEEYVKKMLSTEGKHFEKYGHKPMTDKELDKLFGK